MRFVRQLDIRTCGNVAAAALAATMVVAMGGPPRILDAFGAPAAAMAAVPTTTDTGVLRHMPSTLNGPRLEGAADAIDWPVYLTAVQAAHATRFRVTFTAAISVLPDASSLEVGINGRPIGREAIDAADGKRTVEIDVPPGALQPGFNAVSISARHRHRVDCSPAATYELWTRIDPEDTGLVLRTEDRAITEVADLPAVLTSADGRLPIHVLLPGKMDLARLRRIMVATQTIAMAAHALQPMVDFERDPGDVEGLDLLLGTRQELRRLPEWPRIAADTPTLAVVPALASGHPMLVVTGASDTELDQALSTLMTRIRATGTAAGRALAARFPAAPRTDGASFTLADIGVPSRSADGSLLHQAIDFSLPADFFASDYGRGTLDLAGIYAGDLDRQAQVRVDVNGRSTGIVRLPRVAGGVLDHDQLFLPLGQMHPGLNRIDLLAELPRRGDATCAQPDSRRFTLLDTTRVALPPLAHVLRLPDIGLATAGAIPYDRGTPHLVVPKPDRPTMAAALSLAARAAVAAGKLIPFAFASRAPLTDDGSTLVVAAAQQLDPDLMRAIGLDPDAVERAWHDAAASAPPAARWWLRRPDAPAACRGASAGTVAVQARRAAGDSDDIALVEPVGAASRSPVLEWATSGARSVRGWLDARLGNLQLPTWAGEAPTRFPRSAALIFAQGMTPGSRTNVTTIVTAPTAVGLSASMACLFDPGVWARVRGRLVVLDGDGAVAATEARSFTYVASGTPSLANTRLVVAGWFSSNPLAFAVAALAMAICLSGSTLWLVRNVGRRSP